MYGFIAITVFVLTFLLVRLAIHFFPKIGLLDRPQKYGISRNPIPYCGGLVLFLVFLLSTFIFLDIDRRLLGVLIAATLIVAVSFWDDRKNLSPWIRLSIQIFAALILVFFGVSLGEIRNPFGGVFDVRSIPLLSVFFTVFWIVLIMNTVNFLDGLNGLASGVSSIGFFILFVLSIRPAFHTIDQSAFAVLSLVLAVSAFAFALFEFAPAKILMGDTGSMFLGFMLATLGIFSGGKIATAFLVLGLPILDVFWVIIRRIMQRQSPLKGDLQHIHHRFLKAGFTERQALLILYLISTFFGATALFLETFQKIVALFALVLLLIFLGSFLVFRERKG